MVPKSALATEMGQEKANNSIGKKEPKQHGYGKKEPKQHRHGSKKCFSDIEMGQERAKATQMGQERAKATQMGQERAKATWSRGKKEPNNIRVMDPSLIPLTMHRTLKMYAIPSLYILV